MPLETANTSVRELRTAGPRPSDQLLQRILKTGDAAFAPLLELATSLELFDEDEPTLFAPLHALRLLGEMPKAKMISPLLSQFPVKAYADWNDLSLTWSHEVPTIIGRLGAAAVEPLWQVFDDQTGTNESRGVAMIALNCTVVFEPTLRESLIAAIDQRMASIEDDMERTLLVIGLANCGLAERYSEIMALYRENKLDKELLPAASARQLLLTGGEKGLLWTNYTLAERYEKIKLNSF